VLFSFLHFLENSQRLILFLSWEKWRRFICCFLWSFFFLSSIAGALFISLSLPLASCKIDVLFLCFFGLFFPSRNRPPPYFFWFFSYHPFPLSQISAFSASSPMKIQISPETPFLSQITNFPLCKWHLKFEFKILMQIQICIWKFDIVICFLNMMLFGYYFSFEFLCRSRKIFVCMCFSSLNYCLFIFFYFFREKRNVLFVGLISCTCICKM